MQGHPQEIQTSEPGKTRSQSAPERLGKYEIVERIGRGGFGVVYKGFDPFIKRHVAIKTCTSPDSELRQRFFREAEIAGKLDHSNIVRIFDSGEVEETPFLVQEFLEGQDLDEKIGSRQFVPYPERLLYLIHIARGLEYAHDHGIVHRDIKPGNIRILEDGSAKIMDFGVAMLQHSETRLTQDGMAVGTAAYLAPEQIQGQLTDRRTDIFSYGVLAYELLTGERPFDQDTISATLYSILNDDPRPLTLPASICPASLRRLIDRCLAKNPDERFSDFRAIRRQLDAVLHQMRAQRNRRDLSQELRSVAQPAARQRSFDPRIQPEWSPPSIRLQRKSQWRTFVLPFAALLLAAASYALFASQGFVPLPDAVSAIFDRRGSEPIAAMPTQPPSETAGATQVEGEPPAETAPRETVAATEGNDPVVERPIDGSTESPRKALETAPEPEPEPPPIVEQATLTLGQSWHPAMTVSIDRGKPFTLARTRSRSVDAGDHALTFSLVTPEYRAVETVRVRLEPGAEQTVRSPIARPGRLTVQASLGSPQGTVEVDGTMVGTTPLRGYTLAPGRHRLRVFALANPDRPLSDTRVEIRSSRETVITFDLTGRRDLAVRYRNPSD